jgi:nicotinamide mononucleotide transporter
MEGQKILEFLASNWQEITAVIFGLLSVWLTVRQNIWCWPTGLVQVVLFIPLFYQSKLYSDMILHIIYVGQQIYGWYYWLYGAKAKASLPVTKLKSVALFYWMAISLGGMLVWGYLMHHLAKAAVPYPDAFIAVASLIAQWLMARKRLDSWFFWIAVDVVAIAVYGYKALYFTAGLYLVFLGLCVLGLKQWEKSMHTQTVEATVTP